VREFIVIALLATFSNPARAQAESAAAPSGRMLDDHLFIPSALVRDPFTATYFQSTIGFGYATATGPAFEVAGNVIGGGDYKFATTLQGFEIQLKLYDWWAIRIASQGVLFTAIDSTSAINAGVSARIQPAGGTTVSFPLCPRVRLGGTFDFGYAPDINANIITGVVNSVMARNISLRHLLTDTRLTVYQVGASAAAELHRAVGVVATAAYLHIGSDTDGVTDSVDTVSAGVAFDFDLRPLTPMPIGFVVAYKLNEATTRDSGQASQSIEGGIFYTGVGHLALGFDLEERWFNLLLGPPGPGFLRFEQRTEDTQLTLAQLLMRYTW
jgi:hypothetical protein